MTDQERVDQFLAEHEAATKAREDVTRSRLAIAVIVMLMIVDVSAFAVLGVQAWVNNGLPSEDLRFVLKRVYYPQFILAAGVLTYYGLADAGLISRWFTKSPK